MRKLKWNLVFPFYDTRPAFVCINSGLTDIYTFTYLYNFIVFIMFLRTFDTVYEIMDYRNIRFRGQTWSILKVT